MSEEVPVYGVCQQCLREQKNYNWANCCYEGSLSPAEVREDLSGNVRITWLYCARWFSVRCNRLEDGTLGYLPLGDLPKTSSKPLVAIALLVILLIYLATS